MVVIESSHSLACAGLGFEPSRNASLSNRNRVRLAGRFRTVGRALYQLVRENLPSPPRWAIRNPTGRPNPPPKADVASTTDTDPTPGNQGAQFPIKMSIFFHSRSRDAYCCCSATIITAPCRARDRRSRVARPRRSASVADYRRRSAALRERPVRSRERGLGTAHPCRIPCNREPVTRCRP